MLRKTQEIPAVTMSDLVYGSECHSLTCQNKEKSTMGTRKPMTEETKAKIAAARAANRVTGQKRASLDDQIAAAQAQADSGDAGMQALMPVIDVYREKLTQAVADKKTASKKLRKLLSA
jgi:hypothetical protein